MGVMFDPRTVTAHLASLLSQRLKFSILDVKVGKDMLNIFMLIQLIHQSQYLIRWLA